MRLSRCENVESRWRTRNKKRTIARTKISPHTVYEIILFLLQMHGTCWITVEFIPRVHPKYYSCLYNNDHVCFAYRAEIIVNKPMI